MEQERDAAVRGHSGMRTIATCLIVVWIAGTVRADVRWQHPGGILPGEALAEAQHKLKNHAWAREVYGQRKTQLAAWIRKEHPEIAVIVSTGNVAEIAAECSQIGVAHCLQKPFRLEALAELVRQAAGSRTG